MHIILNVLWKEWSKIRYGLFMQPENSYLNTVLFSCLCLNTCLFFFFFFFLKIDQQIIAEKWSKNALNELELIRSSCTNTKG